jgi:PPOX class probable F420-dependent enzyme
VAQSSIPDPSTPFGQRVQRRLREEIVVWLTAVGNDGTPQPNPVWFIWDGSGILVYNRPDAHRLTHVRRRPRVALHFDGNGQGGDIVVISGRAEVVDGEALPHQVPDYVAKYGPRMNRVSGSLEEFSRQYPVPIWIRDVGVRGW